MNYTHLTPERQAAIRSQHAARGKPQPVVTDQLRAAWEADHYAHSLLAAEATGKQKAEHQKAMAAIEKALGSGKP